MLLTVRTGSTWGREPEAERARGGGTVGPRGAGNEGVGCNRTGKEWKNKGKNGGGNEGGLKPVGAGLFNVLRHHQYVCEPPRNVKVRGRDNKFPPCKSKGYRQSPRAIRPSDLETRMISANRPSDQLSICLL